MDEQKSLLASCLMVIKSFFAMRRSRRFLLALPIVIGIFLILSLQQASDIDLREVSEVRSRNSNIIDNQSPLVSEQQLQQTVGSNLEQEQGNSSSGSSSSHQGDNTNTSGGSMPEPNTPWKGTTVARQIDIPDATWMCTDDNLPLKERETQSNKRSRQCVVQNLCVDRQGAFIRNSQQMATAVPKVNLISSLEGADSFWTPRVEFSESKEMLAHYVDETLFVHGIFWPNHFSHWLYNGMLPLYSTMKRFNGTKDSWSFKVNSYYNEHNPKNQGKWEMRHIFQTGLELVLLKDELVTEFQALPPSDAPICFRQAVIGLGSQCALEYCEKNIPSDVYHSFRDVIAEYYWKTPDDWQLHIRTTLDLFGAGAQTRLTEEAAGRRTENLTIASASTVADTAVPHHANTQKSPLRCLDLARYYNFEPSSGANPLEPLKESRSRVGFRVPDAVDPEVDQSLKGKRRLVVAMIQREGSRRVINDQELVEGLAVAGFRVKWITFDHGCGLAETAYLLRDVHVLASPHGNAIGTSVFMPTINPVPTLISLDPSKYSEPWFINTATALGQRFLSAVCGPHGYVDEATKARCPYYKDLAGAHKGLGIWGTKIVLGLPNELAQSYRDKVAQGNLTEEALQEFRDYVASNSEAQQLAKEELDILIGPELPMTVVEKYDAEIIWFFLEVFWRDAPRYVDVPRVVALVQELQRDQEREQVVAANTERWGGGAFAPEFKYGQYLDYIRRNRACGVKEYCRSVLQRNVMAPSRALGIHSIDDPARWGQPVNVGETVFEGLEESRSNWSMI